MFDDIPSVCHECVYCTHDRGDAITPPYEYCQYDMEEFLSEEGCYNYERKEEEL